MGFAVGGGCDDEIMRVHTLVERYADLALSVADAIVIAWDGLAALGALIGLAGGAAERRPGHLVLGAEEPPRHECAYRRVSETLIR